MWNSWQSQWSGVVEVNQIPSTTLDQGNQNRFSRSIEVARNQGEAPTTLAIANMERISNGARVITRGVRPFIRAQQIKFTGDGFRPNTAAVPGFVTSILPTFVVGFTSAADGKFQLTLPSTGTTSLAEGRYVYNVLVSSGTTVYNMIHGNVLVYQQISAQPS